MGAESDIRPGDILLFHGHSFVSWAIRLFDGTDVNHAAIALTADEMGEATGSGLEANSIGPAIKSNDRTYIRRLRGSPEATPVVAKAREFLASNIPYAYQEIVLLAVLSLTRRVPVNNPLVRRVLRPLLDHAAEFVNSLVDRGRDLMICSEFVYRCYVESRDPNFHLEIGLAARAAGLGGEETLLEWAKHRPELEPMVAGPRPRPTGDPDEIAAEANAELEPLIADFAREQSPEEAASLAPAGFAATVVGPTEVSDDELQRAAVRLRDAFNDLKGRLPLEAIPEMASPWDVFEDTVADFVTPGDLLARCSSLETIAELEP